MRQARWGPCWPCPWPPFLFNSQLYPNSRPITIIYRLGQRPSGPWENPDLIPNRGLPPSQQVTELHNKAPREVQRQHAKDSHSVAAWRDCDAGTEGRAGEENRANEKAVISPLRRQHVYTQRELRFKGQDTEWTAEKVVRTAGREVQDEWGCGSPLQCGGPGRCGSAAEHQPSTKESRV